MAENGKEKKNTRARRTPSGEKSGRQQDQVLSGAAEAPKIGKIAGPKKKPAQGDGQRTRGKAEQKKAEPKKTPAKKAEPKKAQEKAPAAGKKKAEGSRRASGKGGRKASAPAISQTAAQVQAIKAQQEAQEKRAARKGRGSRSKKAQKPPIKVYFLGGLNEIGKNFTLYECQGDMVIVDCGLSFPDEDMPGVDSVIPDFAFVEKNRERIRGVVITHGHEDHIGAVPYLMKKLNVPVYGTALTIGLIEGKLKEHNLSSANLHVTPAGSHIQLGCMDVELIHVNHSIADAVALAIHSPAGTIVHTGDFKIDMTPAEGAMIDLCRFAELGKEGVLALLADSTNAERPGYTQTEQTVNNSLDSLFMRAEGKRIIVATFASSISRVQMIINCAVKYGRKVALSGRSMVNVMGIASELGYLHIPDGVLIDLNLINRYEPGQLVLITTGSQGEPMSALTRMAFSDHRQVAINPNDFIIISARPIPGNEKTVGAVVDELLKQDCTVIYESMYDVHVSGHACQEELKMMQALTKPKYFIPVHGEQKHLRKHAGLAMAMGMPRENIFIGDIGNVLELSEEHMKQLPDVPAGDVLVDGLGVGDVGSIVLRDRKHLSEDGLIVAVCSIDAQSGKVVSGPDIVSRGFVYVRESEA
ncbi:MAG: RNase J family beta-CASP ribonuclease, partial [Acutalibacter sp.]